MPYRSRVRLAVTPGGRGRFPGFDVLAEVDHWDELTAGVVLARLDNHPDSPFFDDAERAIADALVDVILGQQDQPKVPVVAMIGQRLAMGETDGWFYEGMPEDGHAWKQTLAHLDSDAQEAFGLSFAALNWEQRGLLVQRVQDADRWHGLEAKHVWSLWTRYACAAFYSHPWAWNEIGFGGPAFPRGYKNVGVDRLEGWEVAEVDPSDPVPWAQRVEQARRAHVDAFGDPSAWPPHRDA